MTSGTGWRGCGGRIAGCGGVAPVPASSGMTNRHRLNRGGHRQANAALYRAVIVRMQHHEPTRAYVARRPAEYEATAYSRRPTSKVA